MSSDESEKFFVFSFECPSCNDIIEFPPDMKPEINSIAECPNPVCRSNIMITGIEYGVNKKNKNKVKLEIERIPEEEMEKLDRNGQLEDMYLDGEK